MLITITHWLKVNELSNVYFKISLELQKKMPWFCIHEPIPSDSDSQNSGLTRTASINSEEPNQQS